MSVCCRCNSSFFFLLAYCVCVCSSTATDVFGVRPFSNVMDRHLFCLLLLILVLLSLGQVASDGSVNTWRQPYRDTPSYRMSFQGWVCANQTCLYLYGGQGDTDILSSGDLWRLDFKTGEWSVTQEHCSDSRTARIVGHQQDCPLPGPLQVTIGGSFGPGDTVLFGNEFGVVNSNKDVFLATEDNQGKVHWSSTTCHNALNMEITPTLRTLAGEPGTNNLYGLYANGGLVLTKEPFHCEFVNFTEPQTPFVSLSFYNGSMYGIRKGENFSMDLARCDTSFQCQVLSNNLFDLARGEMYQVTIEDSLYFFVLKGSPSLISLHCTEYSITEGSWYNRSEASSDFTFGLYFDAMSVMLVNNSGNLSSGRFVGCVCFM